MKSRLCPQGHSIEGYNSTTYMKYGKVQTSCRKCKVARTRKWREKSGDWLPPTTKSVMASYKEPLKLVKKGFGYYGTIAYDETQKYTQCHLCGNFYKTLGVHVSQAHGKDPRTYRLEFGLPTTLSLTAPKARNKNYEQWANYTDEQKKEVISRMQTGIKERKGRTRTKSLYYKNLEGRCPDQLLEKIEKLAKKINRTPTRREFSIEYGSGYTGSVHLTFGSWVEALKILNLTPRVSGFKNEYDKETLLTLLFDFKQRYGRMPMASDTQRGLLPSRGTYRTYFGSWSRAKEYVK